MKNHSIGGPPWPDYGHINCLLNRLLGHRSIKTARLRVTGFCEGNLPVTGEFPAQKANNAEEVSIWWRHYVPRYLQRGSTEWDVEFGLYIYICMYIYIYGAVKRCTYWSFSWQTNVLACGFGNLYVAVSAVSSLVENRFPPINGLLLYQMFNTKWLAPIHFDGWVMA